VGSEMCIRDRRSTSAALTLRERGVAVQCTIISVMVLISVAKIRRSPQALTAVLSFIALL